MKHRPGRHLGAEPEPSGGFRAVDLDRLAIAASYGLDHLHDVGKDGADEPTRPGPYVNATGHALDLTRSHEAGERPVDSAASAVPE